MVNLPCDIHNALHRSHLSDSLPLVILCRQKFDGKQCMIDLSILLWSWYRTCNFLSHSPSLSRLSPSVKSQSPVKVDVMAPLLCSRKVPSSVVRSLFLDAWHSHKKVRRSNQSSGSSNSICPSSVQSLPSLGTCSLHHFSAPTSRALKASISPAFCLMWLRTVSVQTEVLRIFVVPCFAGHWYTVLPDKLSHIVSLYSFRRPNSALMSASSFKGSPRWALTLINRVAAPASTLFWSFTMMAFKISASGDLDRFSFAPQPIHLWIAWREASLSVKYKRSTWSSCASRHSRRATNSGRLELTPSSSLPTLLDSRVRCSCKSGCDSGVSEFHCMDLKLQKPAPIDLVGGSQEPSPAVHAPAKPKAPKRPDSVPSQYNFSLPSKSTIHSSFPAFCWGAISASTSVFLAAVGTSSAVFTQHSNNFLCFVALMSPLRHHPLILKPQQSDCFFLCMSRSWW